MSLSEFVFTREPWNKGKLIGQKLPLKPEEVWSIRVRLDMAHKVRDLTLFNLAIDSKLRGCDLVKLMVSDIARGTEIVSRAKIVQQKTKRPVSFEITAKTRDALAAWIKLKNLCSLDYLFPSSYRRKDHINTRHYGRLVKKWVCSIGLDSTAYGTHSMRRTKVALIYRQTKNLRAVQILLGHRSLESTVRYLGVEIDDALELSEHIEI
ncbi:tyrosine-type recombinase/integrase [Marinobacter sp. M3C]|uniref:tyrosine-type recombinase/integrase n=1 Tax=Marinobacter sp. M3C TaxID=2917715 RepID=UPI00200C7B5B|nr:tyrosine-type recombinase/integrase [Marinobacter sp. M3C]UQG61436.1 tyrosine-type recombinase/integrase [Marinobacter sp. M3C]